MSVNHTTWKPIKEVSIWLNSRIYWQHLKIKWFSIRKSEIGKCLDKNPDKIPKTFSTCTESIPYRHMYDTFWPQPNCKPTTKGYHINFIEIEIFEWSTSFSLCAGKKVGGWMDGGWEHFPTMFIIITQTKLLPACLPACNPACLPVVVDLVYLPPSIGCERRFWF